MGMDNPDNKLLFDEKVKKTLEENAATLKEIDRLLAIIEGVKKKKETTFRELGITQEMEAENLSIADLSVTEQKLFGLIQNEFLAEHAAKGMDTVLKQTENSSIASIMLARKRLRI